MRFKDYNNKTNIRIISIFNKLITFTANEVLLYLIYYLK